MMLDLEDCLDFGSLKDYRRLDVEGPRVAAASRLELPPRLLETLSREAFTEIAFRMPSSQLEAFAAVLADDEASEAERFVVAELIRNAAIAAEGVLPICQDTGTAAVYGWKGGELSSEGSDVEALSAGARAAYAENRLRASQLAPLGFFEERNTRTNLPALIDLRAAKNGTGYRLCFAAKGGGSANRTSLTMEPPSALDPEVLYAIVRERVSALGSSGCPPYRIAFVAGGAGPDETLYALALAGLGLLDRVRDAADGAAEAATQGRAGAELANAARAATDGGGDGGDGSPRRDRRLEERIMRYAKETGVGAQFGGSRLALEARALRLSRHAASLPLASGVFCSAYRRARALIVPDGVFLERMEADPARFLPPASSILSGARRVDLDRSIEDIRADLAALKAGDFVLLSGTVITARDAAHARFLKGLAEGRELPEYLYRHPVFYAGPTEAAPGEASGSFGPTTAGRMDSYLAALMSRGASLITIAKGSRSRTAAATIAGRGGSYLTAIGGAAALAARKHVVSSQVIDHADLGMEAVRKVVLRELPAMIAIDARGLAFLGAPKVASHA